MPEVITASLEAAVARSAETALERIAAARNAIETIIFGQTVVVEQALVTILAGGARPSGRRTGSRQDETRRNPGCGSGPEYAARSVHARFDAGRHSRLRSLGGVGGSAPELPLRARSDLYPVADGR